MRSNFLDLIIKDLKIPIELDNTEHYLKACSMELQINIENISIVKILSKELDLRNCKQFKYTTKDFLRNFTIIFFQIDRVK